MRFSLRAAVATAALCIGPALPAAAGDVTLTARDGGLSVTGRLVGHDGLVYRLDTPWGRLSVAADAAHCAGPGCPDLTRFAPELRVAAEPWLAERILAPLVADFARTEGLALTRPTPDVMELSLDDRPRLRVRLLALSGGPAPVLAAGDADAALAAGGEGRLLARLPLVPVTAPDAPSGALALDALRATRRDGDWRRLGGEDRPLVWHLTPPGSALDQAATALLGGARTAPRSSASPAALAEALRRDPWGLALLPEPIPEGLIRRDVVTACGLTADLSDFAAAAGEHPLTLPVHWREAPRRLAPSLRALADHLTSPAAQRALAAAGSPAPAATLRQPVTAQGLRLSNALAPGNAEVTLADLRQAAALLRGAERLALTFRFDDRGQALDAASATALADLSAHLETGTFRGQELLLLGFTDSAGPADRNRALALSRAGAVLEALQEAAPDLPADTRLSAHGLGEVMPVACDDSVQGRRLNRRVEVWTRPLPR